MTCPRDAHAGQRHRREATRSESTRSESRIGNQEDRAEDITNRATSVWRTTCLVAQDRQVLVTGWSDLHTGAKAPHVTSSRALSSARALVLAASAPACPPCCCCQPGRARARSPRSRSVLPRVSPTLGAAEGHLRCRSIRSGMASRPKGRQGSLTSGERWVA